MALESAAFVRLRLLWRPLLLVVAALAAAALLLRAGGPALASRAFVPDGVALREFDVSFNDTNATAANELAVDASAPDAALSGSGSCGCATNDTLEALTQRWRAAEYAVQVGGRRERALREALRVKTVNQSSGDYLTWESPAPAAELEAKLNETRTALEALRPELTRLRAEIDAVWPPSDSSVPHFKPPAANSTAPPASSELPPESNCAASRLRGGARPHPTSPLPPGAFTRRVNISFLLQYFNHPANIDAYVDTLYACTHGSAYGGPYAAGVPPGTTSELVVNVDSRGDAAAWDAAVNRTAAGSFLTVLLSNNLHEVHGYNRAAAVARGDVLVVLQDDTLPPTDCRWVTDLLARFRAFPRLGAVGMNVGDVWTPAAAHEAAGGAPERAHRREGTGGILFRHQGVPFQFVTVADFSPFAMRAAALAAVGGMDEGLASPGECGIFTDFELSQRFWTAGWQVGHMRMREGFRGSGIGGTHRSPKATAQCWGKQVGLNLGVVEQRYSAADVAAIFAQVCELNSRLEAAFDGEPPWVRCCGGDAGPPHRGRCDPCGAVHNGFVDVPPL